MRNGKEDFLKADTLTAIESHLNLMEKEVKAKKYAIVVQPQMKLTQVISVVGILRAKN